MVEESRIVTAPTRPRGLLMESWRKLPACDLGTGSSSELMTDRIGKLEAYPT